MKQIELTQITEFRDPFLAAGSGLVCAEGEMFLIADDELKIFSYPMKLDGAGRTWPLFPGELPVDRRQRKMLKPDLESMCLHGGYIYCFPSGSTSHRMQGAKFCLQTRTTEIFNCSLLYEKISETFSEINIEGSLVVKDELILFQRGNGKKNENGLIFVDFKTFTLKSIKAIHLGILNGVPLSFTDAAHAHGRISFIAVAEDSQSTYEDGQIQGSVLGYLNERYEVVEMHTLATTAKPEGLWMDDKEFYVVTDDDDPKRPSRLLKGLIP